MGTTSQSIPQVLRRSAEVMKAKGYARGIRHNVHDSRYKTGAVCALGAIEDALGIPNYALGPFNPVTEALAEHIAEQYGKPTASRVANWNNADDRTAEEVIATFLAAAACEERKLQSSSQE